MAKGAKRKGRSRRLLLGAGGTVAALAVWGFVSCIPPRSFKAVKSPREGRAMNNTVAVVYSKHYQINLGGPERMHPFDIRKYSKIYLKLNTDGLLRPADVFVPESVSRAELLRVHTPAYLESLKSSANVARYLEAPLVAAMPAKLVDAGILNAFRYASGGSILAGRKALKYGIAVNLGGGLHHAKADLGEGFCVYADMAIAIRVLQGEGLVKRALIVDLDVHQGNGSAEIFAGDESVFTFSMHQGDIYPIPKAKSDLDVEVPAGTGDEEYLAILASHLPKVMAAARPDVVFLQAGADTLAGDQLGGLRMSPEGIARRDGMVIDRCVEAGIPVMMCLGGGYSDRAWEAQYLSVRRTVLKYGLAGQRPHPRRDPTAKERLYTK